MSPVRLAAMLLALALAGCATPVEPGRFEIYLVRHAEKSTDGDDPGLTPAGEERAGWLAAFLAPRSPSAVWSSDYRRTRQTAAPTAREQDLEVRIYDPRKLEDLAAILISRAETALVVGHSNTTPQLASILCDCMVAPMAESEYDRMIVVTVAGDRRSVRELRTGISRPIGEP